MRTATIIARGLLGHQQAWGDAFAEGLRKRGWRVTVQADYDPADLVVIWGTRRQDWVSRQKANGGDTCILERGYLGDRFAWTSVSFGGALNGRAEFRGVRDDPGRFEKHFANLMKPWRDPGSYALLIGQVPGDMSIRHVNIETWYQRNADALKKAGWEVRFRQHPLADRRGVTRAAGIERTQGGSLHQDMEGAGLVVTFNSNTGVEAALFGSPVIACDEGSMAWPIAGHEITDVIRPYRYEWASRLAWKQFSEDEIRSGFCHEVIGL